MDFEGISRNISLAMGPQNVTALLMSLISQFGRSTRTRDDAGNKAFPIDHQEIDDEDMDMIVAHNLSAILLRNYHHNASLLDDILRNLKDEENRWREESNRRLSDQTFNIIMPIYVRF